ncbi:MAG: hypothetical protein U0Z75_02175 [Deinococcaceae bacterium]
MQRGTRITDPNSQMQRFMMRISINGKPDNVMVAVDSSDGRVITIFPQRGRVPDQAMMVFLSMVALLDGVRRFLDQKGKPPFVFYAVNSSYGFTIMPSWPRPSGKAYKRHWRCRT